MIALTPLPHLYSATLFSPLLLAFNRGWVQLPRNLLGWLILMTPSNLLLDCGANLLAWESKLFSVQGSPSFDSNSYHSTVLLMPQLHSAYYWTPGTLYHLIHVSIFPCCSLYPFLTLHLMIPLKSQFKYHSPYKVFTYLSCPDLVKPDNSLGSHCTWFNSCVSAICN